MKYYFLLFIFINGAGLIYGQKSNDLEIETTFSKVFKDDKKFTELSFSVDDSKGGLFIGRSYKRGCYIEHYDSSLDLLSSYDFELDNKHSKILEAFVDEGKLIVVEANYNRDANQLQYLAHQTQIENFDFKASKMLGIDFNKFRKLAAVVAFVPINFGGVDGDFFGNRVISKGREHFVITQDIKDKDSELRQVHVFNKKMKKLYSHLFERNIKDKDFELQNVDIDKNGTVYMLGKVKTEKAENKDEGGKYQYELYKIHGEKREKLTFSSAEKYVGSLTTVINDGELFCIGFYSEKNDNRFKGLVHFGIDNDNLSIKSSRYSPFTDQFIFDKYGKEKEKELRNIRFKEVHVNEKNELILNGEERYVTSHFMNMQNYIIYHYEDIISAKLDSSGKLIWARNINKSQASRKISPYLSYTSVYRNGKIYFFINGSEEVREMTNDRIEFGVPLLKKMNLYAISLNDAGKMDYKKIIEDDESDVSFSAGNGLILNDGECLLFQGRRKRKKQITRLEL